MGPITLDQLKQSSGMNSVTACWEVREFVGQLQRVMFNSTMNIKSKHSSVPWMIPKTFNVSVDLE